MYELIEKAGDKIGYEELAAKLRDKGHKAMARGLYKAVKDKSKVKTSPAFFNVMVEILGKREVDKVVYGK